MVVVGPDGKISDQWMRELARSLSTSLNPVIRPIVEPVMDRLTAQLAPITDIAMQAVTDQVLDDVSSLLRDVTEQLTARVITPDFVALLEEIRRELPDNWPDGVDLDDVATVIQDDGLPLVWVPPADVVDELLAAPDRAARVQVLLDHAEELLTDCRRVLADIDADRLQSQLPLAPRALDALAAGHHEAAQALAVLVIDATIGGWIKGKFERVAEQVHFDPETLAYDGIRLQAAVAPVRNFKQRYFAETDSTRPDGLNRQVTVHYADAEHFTRGNALVACLLMTSILRALQDFEDYYVPAPVA